MSSAIAGALACLAVVRVFDVAFRVNAVGVPERFRKEREDGKSDELLTSYALPNSSRVLESVGLALILSSLYRS